MKAREARQRFMFVGSPYFLSEDEDGYVHGEISHEDNCGDVSDRYLKFAIRREDLVRFAAGVLSEFAPMIATTTTNNAVTVTYR